jgi:hypothetical protein
MLNLAEELFLISINDEKGVVHSSASPNLRYGLAGAVLADLTLLAKLGLDKTRHVVVLDGTLTGDELLDEALVRILSSDRARRPSYWVSELSQHVKQFQSRLASGLATMGILRKEGLRFMWIIPYAIYPQQDASAKYWIKHRLREAVLANVTPDQRTVVLLSLLRACSMLDLVFTKDERKAVRHKIEQISRDEVFGQAVTQTLDAIEEAAVAAIIAAATA